MSPLPLLLAAAAVAVLVPSVLVAASVLARAQRLRRRLALAQGAPARGELRGERAPGGRYLLLRIVAAIGEGAARSGLLPGRTLAELRVTLAQAGFHGHGGFTLFLGAKLVLLAGFPLLALLVFDGTGWAPPMPAAFVFGAGVLGLLLPDFAVRSMRRRYLRDLEAGLPEALDMMVICAEAGLGLEPAVERVGHEMRGSNRAVSGELLHTSREMRLSVDRRAALLNMGMRTGLDSLRRFGSTLVQSMQYGTPLSQALRTLSAEMRQESLTRFEERAARLPVLLTMPMIVFILPCVFMVVGGPAVVQVLHVMGH